MYELLSFNKNLEYCRLSLVNNDKKQPFQDDYLHYPVLHQVLNMMKMRGFKVDRDPEVEKHCKSICKDYWYGRKGDLEFKAHRYPNGFELEFFQNVVFKNKNGGQYDFDKYEIMPYLIRLMLINELKYIERFLNSLGVAKSNRKSADDFKLAEDKVKFNYVDSWHHPEKDMNFNLSDVKHNQTDYNSLDREKKQIENGQLKYFRDYSGRLSRGVVFHNINSMWWVITDKFTLRNISSFGLFDPTPDDFAIRRLTRSTRNGETLAKDRNKGKVKFYYIWSKKHSDKSGLAFWGPAYSGYTVDLNDAGIYTLEQIAKSSYNFETITKDNVQQVKSSKKNLSDSFLIAVDDVQLLGRKIVKIAIQRGVQS